MSRVEALADLIAAALGHTKKVYGDNLVGLLQFGSTVNQIKPVTDLDLLVVAKNISPDPAERDRKWLEVESLLAAQLKKARDSGLQLSLSPIIKTPDEASVFQSYYLDLPECSVALHDPDHFVENLVERVRIYIRESGAVKKRVGNLWYWDLAPDATYKDIRKIGW